MWQGSPRWWHQLCRDFACELGRTHRACSPHERYACAHALAFRFPHAQCCFSLMLLPMLFGTAHGECLRACVLLCLYPPMPLCLPVSVPSCLCVSYLSVRSSKWCYRTMQSVGHAVSDNRLLWGSGVGQQHMCTCSSWLPECRPLSAGLCQSGPCLCCMHRGPSRALCACCAWLIQAASAGPVAHASAGPLLEQGFEPAGWINSPLSRERATCQLPPTD